MRWSAIITSMSLLAGFGSAVEAQTYSSSNRGSVTSYPAPYAPGCATPGSMPSIGSGMPGSGMPGSGMPGSGMSGSGSGLGSGTGAGTGAGAAGAAGAAAAAGAAGAAGSGDPSGAAGESGSSALASASNQMIGDLVGGGFARTQSSSSGGRSSSSRTPLVNRGAFKIAENESPRPQDRVFTTFNYFNNVGGSIAPPGQDIYRGVIGFEKTFLDGNASFGMRVPIQGSGTSGTSGIDGIGDLTFVTKYAFYNDLQTGNILSGGLVVTAPTGPSVTLSDGHALNGVFLQPWTGGFLSLSPDLYVLGFTSLVISTDSRDVNLFAADVGVGYRIYQGAADDIITSLTPTLEGHVTTALNNSSPTSDVYFPDLFVMTAGVHIGLMNQAYLTIGAAIPVTTPQFYGYELIAQFNYRF